MQRVLGMGGHISEELVQVVHYFLEGVVQVLSLLALQLVVHLEVRGPFAQLHHLLNLDYSFLKLSGLEPIAALFHGIVSRQLELAAAVEAVDATEHHDELIFGRP